MCYLGRRNDLDMESADDMVSMVPREHRPRTRASRVEVERTAAIEVTRVQISLVGSLMMVRGISYVVEGRVKWLTGVFGIIRAQ